MRDRCLMEMLQSGPSTQGSNATIFYHRQLLTQPDQYNLVLILEETSRKALRCTQTKTRNQNSQARERPGHLMPPR